MKAKGPVPRKWVRIGTSGWHYGHWRGPFYPKDLPSARMLAWYAQHFDTVEINNSFYRLPTTEALAAWCRETPREFCFAVKASRYIKVTRSFSLKLRDWGGGSGPRCFNCRLAGSSTFKDWTSFLPLSQEGVAMVSSFVTLHGT